MGKIALVTGASSGLGRAVSIALGGAGYRLILTGRNKTELEKTSSLVANSQTIISDLSDIDSINLLIKKIKQITKQINVLVNLAGIWHGQNEVYAGKNYEEFDQQVIIDTLNVGILAPLLLTHGLIPLMSSGSNIINISGTFESGAKGWLPYYVSKRAIEDLTIGLAQELERKDIQVNAISPSDCATFAYKKYFPQYIDEAIAPEKIAEFIVNICQKDITGKVFVLKKNQQPFESFHY